LKKCKLFLPLQQRVLPTPASVPVMKNVVGFIPQHQSGNVVGNPSKPLTESV
jgi:hypothetical protein